MYHTSVNCFTTAKNAIFIGIVLEKEVDAWLAQQSENTQRWAKANEFKQKKFTPQ